MSTPNLEVKGVDSLSFLKKSSSTSSLLTPAHDPSKHLIKAKTDHASQPILANAKDQLMLSVRSRRRRYSTTDRFQAKDAVQHFVQEKINPKKSILQSKS